MTPTRRRLLALLAVGLCQIALAAGAAWLLSIKTTTASGGVVHSLICYEREFHFVGYPVPCMEQHQDIRTGFTFPEDDDGVVSYGVIGRDPVKFDGRNLAVLPVMLLAAVS